MFQGCLHLFSREMVATVMEEEEEEEREEGEQEAEEMRQCLWMEWGPCLSDSWGAPAGLGGFCWRRWDCALLARV